MDLLPAGRPAAAARLWDELDPPWPEAFRTAMEVDEALGYLWPRLQQLQPGQPTLS